MIAKFYTERQFLIKTTINKHFIYGLIIFIHSVIFLYATLKLSKQTALQAAGRVTAKLTAS